MYLIVLSMFSPQTANLMYYLYYVKMLAPDTNILTGGDQLLDACGPPPVVSRPT